MTDTTTAIPALPNASIDMNKLFENDAAGLTGPEMLDGAVLIAPAGEPVAPETEAPPRAPQRGDSVTRDDLGGGWVAISAPWLDAPVKVQGEPAATDKIDELMALVPAS